MNVYTVDFYSMLCFYFKLVACCIRSIYMSILASKAAALSAPKRPLPETGPFAAAGPSVSRAQTRQKQQLEFLLKRQLQFKQAAMNAKNKGDIVNAKKYLLAAKVVVSF